MTLRALTPRILLSAMASAIIALFLVIFAATTERSSVQAQFDARIVGAENIQACEAAPEQWRLDGPRVHAYDRDGQSRNPDAPPLEPELLERLRAGGVDRARHPERGDSLVLLRAAGDGPCAVFRMEFPGRPAGPPWAGWGFPLLASISMLVVAGVSYATTVRPLVRRVRRLAQQAEAVGREDYGGVDDDISDDLGHIGAALTRSHERIQADRDELLARHRALEEHMASIAHDLRTPLASMQLSIEALAGEPESDEEAQIARRAVEDAVYLGALVENLHQAVRLRHGLDAREGQVDLREVVARVAERFGVLGQAEGVDVASAQPDDPVIVQCTPALAERAVANLVHNAVVHNDHGPDQRGHVAVLLERTGDRFVLTVLDDGPGVPPAQVADLAHRTFQVEDARRRGPGLGVAITNEVARRVGWEIHYEREEPRGLRVTIRGGCA